MLMERGPIETWPPGLGRLRWAVFGDRLGRLDGPGRCRHEASVLCKGTSCDIVDAGLVDCRNICIGGRLPPGQLQLSAASLTAGAWVARMAGARDNGGHRR